MPESIYIKVCTKCGIKKSIDEFYEDKKASDGHFSSCKECNRELKRKLYHKDSKIKEQQKKWRYKNKSKTSVYNRRCKIKQTYGLSLDEWEIKFKNQKGRCAICNVHQFDLERRLDTDHNHTTGKVRDLLCHRCNLLVGQLELNPGLLKSIISYLERHDGEEK